MKFSKLRQALLKGYFRTASILLVYLNLLVFFMYISGEETLKISKAVTTHFYSQWLVGFLRRYDIDCNIEQNKALGVHRSLDLNTCKALPLLSLFRSPNWYVAFASDSEALRSRRIPDESVKRFYRYYCKQALSYPREQKSLVFT